MRRPLAKPLGSFTLANIEAHGTNVMRPTREDLERWRETARERLARGESEEATVFTHGLALVIDRLCERVQELEKELTTRETLVDQLWNRLNVAEQEGIGT